MSWDPYATLGVPKGADESTIRKAYRKLAKDNHPDVRPGDASAEERFKRATAAFNLLTDKNQKARFDRGEIDAEGQERQRFRPGGPGGPGAGGYPGGSPFTRGGGGFQQGAGGEPFEDLFSGLFGGGRGRARSSFKGEDIHYKVNIDFLDAVTGAKRRLQMADGKTLDVAVPAGLRSGQTLRLRSQGQPGMSGGPPGDALLDVTVRDHDFFSRDGADLRLSLPISLAEAVEGGKVEVETPLGKVALNVPAGSNTGTTLRLRGKGVQLSKGPGDLYVMLMIMLPDRPSSDLKDFVKKWKQRGEKPDRNRKN